jgi:thioester reductase-like protein
MKIFITGATGFLGKYLVKELSPQFETIYVLTRNIDFPDFKQIPNVTLIKGDITNQNIIENSIDLENVITECDFFIHAAALYDMVANHADCYLQNVVGTQNTINLIKSMKKLKAFYYISTIAVGDDKTFFLEENKLPKRKRFSDFYSETKYHAEKMVRETFEKDLFHIPVRIVRPGIIVGDSETGEMNKVDGPYYIINAFKKYAPVLKLIPFLPLTYNPLTKIPLIPVDHCAQAISLLILRDKGDLALKTYHLISDEMPSTKEFLKDLNKYFGLKTTYYPLFKNVIFDTALNLLGIPREVIPFMFSSLSYDKRQTKKELPELKLSRYSLYKEKLFGITF